MEITDVNTLFGAYPAQHPDSNAETLVEAMQTEGRGLVPGPVHLGPVPFRARRQRARPCGRVKPTTT